MKQTVKEQIAFFILLFLPVLLVCAWIVLPMIIMVFLGECYMEYGYVIGSIVFLCCLLFVAMNDKTINRKI